jgi:hypothetical protein
VEQRGGLDAERRVDEPGDDVPLRRRGFHARGDAQHGRTAGVAPVGVDLGQETGMARADDFSRCLGARSRSGYGRICGGANWRLTGAGSAAQCATGDRPLTPRRRPRRTPAGPHGRWAYRR